MNKYKNLGTFLKETELNRLLKWVPTLSPESSFYLDKDFIETYTKIQRVINNFGRGIYRFQTRSIDDIKFLKKMQLKIQNPFSTNF